MGDVDVRVLDDPASAAADLLRESARAGQDIVLTGGSTPARAYELAADADWSRARIWFSDDRCVGPDDELSNYRLVKESLLDRIEGGAPEVHRIRGERGPHPGADDYDRDIRETLGEHIPRFDLVLLGLGSDAHVASLFPGHASLKVADRATVGEEEAGLEPFVPRVSLTLAALNNGRHVVFLVTGGSKAEAVEKAFRRDPSPDAPGSLVRPRDGRMTVLLDPAAAGEVHR
jgi:6-phosphogluconolactonase